MVLFRDFYKPVKNFFGNNYNDDKIVLKTKTKPNKNLELNFETKREKGKDYAAKLSWTGNFKVQDASVKVEGEVLQVGEVSEKVVVKGLYDGLTLDAKVKLLTEKSNDTKPKEKDEDKVSRDTVTFGVTYNHKHVDTNVEVTKKALNPVTVYGGLALKYEEFALGGDFEYEFKERKPEDKSALLKNYNLGATLTTENLLLAALVEKSFTDAKIGVHHSIDKDTSLGVEFSHKINKAEPFVVQVGLSKKLDDQSNVKAKLLSTGFATVAYQVKVKPDVTATVSFETSAKELSNVGKIGVELAFEPLD